MKNKSQAKNTLEIHFLLKNLQSTEKFAKILYLSIEFPITICLVGPLGVGKTQLSKFLASYFGIRENLISSSFIKSRIYKNTQDRKLLHIDAYNARSLNETWALAHEENDVDLTIVEWAQNALFDKILSNVIVIEFNYSELLERTIVVTGPSSFIKKLQTNWKNVSK